MRTNKKLLVLFLSFTFFSFSFAQNETNTWYFGSAAGLDFNSGTPVPLLNGTIVPTSEGSATMSDRTTGAFLLGTNGVNIWGKNLAVMPNGAGVGSNIAISSAQNSVIVPAPCSDSLFYVFTTDANENNYTNGLRYSVVDMTLNGGNGDVLPGQKNIPLIAPACEKVAAVHDANGQDIWVVTIAVNTNNFYAYKVSTAGVSAPVISTIGRVYVAPDMPRAYLKFSPNGQKIFSVVGWFNGASELFDFNNSTGVVSNRIGLDVHSYGASFSNNSQVLYAADNTQVFQYDVSSNNAATILASKQQVGNVPGLMRAMQLGIDGKIYIANTSNNAFLSVINNPNVVGTGCNVSPNTFSLGGRNAIFGLPNFIESYFDPNYAYVPCVMTASANTTPSNCTAPCTGTATATVLGGIPPFTFSWNTNPVQNTQIATGLCPGSYTVTVTDSINTVDTAVVVVTQIAIPNVTPGPTLTLGCINNSGSISASSTSPVTYNWVGPGIVAGGATNNPTINAQGTYTVTVTDTVTGCTNTATVLVNVDTIPPTITPVANTITCTSATVTITSTTSPSGLTYNWSGPGIVSGGTSGGPTVNAPGTYTVTITNPINGCTNTATVTIAADTTLPNLTMGNPLVLTGCVNPSGTISANSTTPNATYSWSGSGIASGGTTNSPTVNSPGTYTVVITNPTNGCTKTDSVLVTTNTPIPNITTSPLTIPCTQDTGIVIASSTTPNVTYSWSGPGIIAGGTTNNPTVNSGGVYTVIVTDPVTGCTNTSTVTVSLTPGPTASVSPDITIIQGDSTILTANGGATYLWNPSTNLSSSSGVSVTATPAETTTYCVEVTDNNGCKDTACVTVTVEAPCPLSENLAIPNAFSPNNDGVNDEFCLQGWDACIENFSIVIFNRWGQKVFESKDPNFCWDGKYNNTIMDAQVVVYYLKATYLNLDKAIEKNGNISLLR